MEAWAKLLGGFFLFVTALGHRRFARWLRIRRYTRGTVLQAARRRIANTPPRSDAIRFGNEWLPARAATQHFLVAGPTGSGKSLLQRLSLAEPLRRIRPGSDSRALIFDAKGETTAYLSRLGTTAPVYSLNPFESRQELPQAVAWDVGSDITTPLQANNFSHSLITGDAAGTNGYFVKAARAVVAACLKSFIRHAGTAWTFTDLVYATTHSERLKQVLGRDRGGEEILNMFLAENPTGYGVATTVAADMERYAPVAALWQRCPQRLSIRQWLKDCSILLLGENETASATLDILNQQIFTLFVEEVLVQPNSSFRRTFLWIDEAQEAGCILQSGKLQSFAAKARSRGGSLWIAFQDFEGFRKAAGDPRTGDSIIAQCNHKALLRQASSESAKWASELLGQVQTLQVFRSDSRDWRWPDPGTEQRVVAEAVMPSEFYTIPQSSPERGLTGYFLSPEFGAQRMTVPAAEIAGVVVGESLEAEHAVVPRPETDQWLKSWTTADCERLGLRSAQAERKALKLAKLRNRC